MCRGLKPSLGKVLLKRLNSYSVHCGILDGDQPTKMLKNVPWYTTQCYRSDIVKLDKVLILRDEGLLSDGEYFFDRSDKIVDVSNNNVIIWLFTHA